MGCGAGRLDCPSCAGSVLHDASTVRDLGFAMAMQSNEIRQDRFTEMTSSSPGKQPDKKRK